MYQAIERFLKDESGSVPIEYGLIGAGILLAFISMLAGLSRELRQALGQGKGGAQEADNRTK